MAVEAKRGCGYRKVGGLYLVSGKLMEPCLGLPIPLKVCPTCGGGIKPARGWTWINGKVLIKDHFKNTLMSVIANCRNERFCAHCPVGNAENLLNDRDGLLWIGERHYTVQEFREEAARMGVSRRIAHLPKDFELGKHWVFMAHRKAMMVPAEEAEGEVFTDQAAIVTAFKPTAIEKIVTETESRDEEEMHKLAKRGITPVAVPDDDPDHQ